MLVALSEEAAFARVFGQRVRQDLIPIIDVVPKVDPIVTINPGGQIGDLHRQGLIKIDLFAFAAADGIDDPVQRPARLALENGVRQGLRDRQPVRNHG